MKHLKKFKLTPGRVAIFSPTIGSMINIVHFYKTNFENHCNVFLKDKIMFQNFRIKSIIDGSPMDGIVSIRIKGSAQVIIQ